MILLIGVVFLILVNVRKIETAKGSIELRAMIPLLALTSFFILVKSTLSQDITTSRTKDPIEIDGALDEAAWGKVQALEDFYQFEPAYGAKISCQTSVKVIYDSHSIYFGFDA